MKLIYFTAGDFGLPALSALHQSSHVIQGVVTTPDKPQGRGQHVQPAPAKVLAEKLGIPVLRINKVNKPESLEELRTFSSDVFVVASFGQILNNDFLNLPPCGCVNIHPSLLPKYRGASPIAEALMQGDQVVGTTTMRVSSELDAGDILLQDCITLQGNENAKDVWDRLAVLSGELLVRTLDELEEGSLKAVPQNSKKATYCSKLTKEDSALDWSWTAEKIHNRVRGLYLWPGTTTVMNGKKLKIIQTLVDSSLGNDQKKPGEVLEIKDPHGIRVACGKGSVYIHKLQLEGKRPMRYDDFAHGHQIKPGLVLGEAF